MNPKMHLLFLCGLLTFFGGALTTGCSGAKKKKALQKMRTHFQAASKNNGDRCEASFKQKSDAVTIRFDACTDGEFVQWVAKHVNNKAYIDVAQDAGFKWLHFTNGKRGCSIQTRKTTHCTQRK